MLSVYLRLLSACRRTFGSGKAFLGWLILVPAFFLFTQITLWLDRLFFPGYRKVEVKQPVFIIGHPRSGTTLLHRTLTQCGEFACYRAWELFFPALTARWLVRPLLSLQRRRRRTLVPAEVGHEVGLDEVEEEEFLFLHRLDTQFLLTRTPLAFDEFEHPEVRLHDAQPAARRRASAAFFKECLQRQIFVTGRSRVVAQLHFSVHRVKTLLETFPDARFIYLVRSPLETIPSHLSLVQAGLKFQWGENRLPREVMERFFERRYRYNRDLYEYSRELFQTGVLNERNTLVLPYEMLSSNLQAGMARVFEFIGHRPSETLQATITAQAVEQKAYQRPHTVLPLEAFGLSEARVREDLAFVFNGFPGRARPGVVPAPRQALEQSTQRIEEDDPHPGIARLPHHTPSRRPLPTPSAPRPAGQRADSDVPFVAAGV